MLSKEYLIGLETIVRSEISRFLRIWPQSLLASALMALLYFVIFRQLGPLQNFESHSFTYTQFLAPGLIMMAVIGNAFGNVAFSVSTHRLQGSMEEITVAPLPNYIVLLGFIIAGTLRGILVGIIVTIIALFFTTLQVHSFAIISLALLMASILFSLVGFTNAIYATRYEDVVWVPTFLLNPLIYLGGVFFSIHQLPEFWQVVARFNPLLYLINSFRYGMLGVSDVNVYGSLVFLFISILTLFIFNVYLLKKGIGVKK